VSERALLICVVGTGSIGLRHLKLLSEMSGVSAVALPKRASRAADLRERGFKCLEHDADLRSLPLDGVVIATDTAAHVPDALRLDSNVGLLIEKPLAVDAGQAEALLARSGFVACVLRFNEGLAWVKTKLDSLGRIQFVDAECLSWLPDWRPGRDYRESYSVRPREGGVLRDLIHEVDYLQWLFGPPRAISGSTWNSGLLDTTPTLDESATASWLTPTGARVNLRLSFAVRPTTRRLRIWGEHGKLSWDAIGRHAELISTDGKELETVSWGEPMQMYSDQLTAWVSSLRGGSPGQLATIQDGVAALRVVDAVRASAMKEAFDER
jgi:predicted dehydrogenase